MPAKAALTAFVAALALCAALLAPVAECPAAGPKVEIFVTSWCPYCTKAKAYFDGKGIAYAVYDIDKDAKCQQRLKRDHDLIVLDEVSRQYQYAFLLH